MNSDNFPPDSPDLSVVVPHFNQPQQLAHVLENLLGQKSVRLEVLVVDDASEQPCDAVVAAFQGRGLCVSLLRQPERRYTLAARLRGMGEAHGRWLAFMDADDGICSPTAYAQAVKAADAAQTDILHFITLADKEGQRRSWNNAMPFHNATLRGEEIFRTWLAADCRAHSVWNKLYSRSLYQRLLSLDHHLPIFRIEDFYLTAHFLLLAQTYTPCDIAVYLYTPPAGTHLEKAAARAVDAMSVSMDVPPQYRNNLVPLMASVENLEVTPDTAAKVVVDEKTGTVVLGRDVRISRAAVAHGNLQITVQEGEQVSQPGPFSQGQTVVTPQTDINVREENRRLMMVEGATLQELVDGLNAIGATPRDLISILRSLQASGSLHAELEVI